MWDYSLCLRHDNLFHQNMIQSSWSQTNESGFVWHNISLSSLCFGHKNNCFGVSGWHLYFGCGCAIHNLLLYIVADQSSAASFMIINACDISLILVHYESNDESQEKQTYLPSFKNQSWYSDRVYIDYAVDKMYNFSTHPDGNAVICWEFYNELAPCFLFWFVQRSNSADHLDVAFVRFSWRLFTHFVSLQWVKWNRRLGKYASLCACQTDLTSPKTCLLITDSAVKNWQLRCI